MTIAVLLLDPKYPHNVGNVLRACALLGVSRLAWTGTRVPGPDEWPEGARLPREERMRCYERVDMQRLWDGGSDPARPVTYLSLPTGAPVLTPVCIEITEGAEDLRLFRHPEHALYVFGPEDGSVPRGIRRKCHRFVRIPTALAGERTPYNLAAAVNLVLYDRLFKASLEPCLTGALANTSEAQYVRP